MNKNSWSSDEEAEEVHAIYPARDSERSHKLISSEQRESSVRREAPIGVFDSGVGGLTILSALRKELPQERYIYFGDTARCPYGNKTEAEITEFSLQASRFLSAQGAKLIVVACNTASQAALSTLRANFPLPFVGVVPAVKPAARITRHGRIGVAATNQAVRAAYLRQLIDDFAEGIEVHTVGCPELVTLVEQGELDGPFVEETLRHSLHPLIIRNIDVLVLGCTHFPALRSSIEHVMGKDVQVVDSGTAIARRTHSILDAERCVRPLHSNDAQGETQFWCSGDSIHFSEVASRLLGYQVTARQTLF